VQFSSKIGHQESINRNLYINRQIIFNYTKYSTHNSN